MTVRVAILGDTLRTPLRGIGTYTWRLAEALKATYPEHEYVVIRPASDAYARWSGATIEVIVTGGPLAKFHEEAWGAWSGPRTAARGGFDLVHAPGNIKSFLLFPRSDAKKVLTLHDLTPRILPQTHKWKIRQEFRWLLEPAIIRSDGIVCDSGATLRDLRQIIPAAAMRPSEVIHLGADSRYFDAGARRPPRPDFVPDPYFLCVGSIEPRKNLVTVLRAFARRRASGGREHLVVVGPKGWGNKEFYRLVTSLSLDEVIHFTGYVREEQMPALYAHALALLYPSSYEGFGLPVVEAMAAGCPVVTSNVSSLPEVAGEAGILVRPQDEEALAHAIAAISEDDTLRARLVIMGRTQASQFTWTRAAQRTQAFFDRVIAQ